MRRRQCDIIPVKIHGGYAVPFLEESQQVSKNTYQPTKQWGPTVAAFREDLQSPQCAFLNVTLS